MKKGRHRRFEEARALKRSHEVDLNDLFESISDAPEGEHKPEHDAWADMAEEWDSKQSAQESEASEADSATSDDAESNDASAADSDGSSDSDDSDVVADNDDDDSGSATSESEAAS